VIGHLLGNLQIFIERNQINDYAHRGTRATHSDNHEVDYGARETCPPRAESRPGSDDRW
jgi:hypothetical protein